MRNTRVSIEGESANGPTVRLLLKHNDDVTRNDSRGLISLTGKGDPLSVLHALVNVDLKNLALCFGLLALALLAAVLLLDGLALAIAVLADSLNLLHHARTNLSQANCGTLTLTGLTSL